jgi:hypothetical protein
MSNDLNAEMEATRKLAEFLELAKKCEQLYMRANMALPEPLKRVLGVNGAGPLTGRVVIPPPQAPQMPLEARSDWIWIPVKDATATSIVLATLRVAKEPVKAKDVASSVTGILPNVLSGSVFNVGSRLDGEKVRRTDEGWSLLKPEYGGVILDGFLWGPVEIFQKTELAAHRREAIIYLLKSFEGGLQTRQIVEQLHRCTWVHAPINKDLLKADLEILDDKGLIKRRGNSKKWGLVPTQKGES